MRPTERARWRRFHRSKLVPLARGLRERDRRFFPLGPDDAETWYDPPDEGEALFDLDRGWEQALRELYASEDLPELEALVSELADLASKLRLDDEEPEEISPFIYVMY